ncbi:MAG TPA: GNAT family N-acetyltransferase [Anaerolineae bacterium]|nr:GNAT family N-acetyltransferase [Anaerolineae bacterium]
MRFLTSAEDISPYQLHGFFVGWSHPPSPETHLAILRRSDAVVLAVDEETGRVVGFVNALSDGVLNAFIPLLEVLPAYQGRGIGSELARRMLAQLGNLYAVDLLCDADVQPFYARLGMIAGQGMVLRRYDRQSGRAEATQAVDFQVRTLEAADQPQVAAWMAEHWGSEIMISRGVVRRPAVLPGFAAVSGEGWLGLLTYHIDGDACEIVTIDSVQPNAGVGTALIETAKRAAVQAGCRRLWLITTNDNTAALRFYQKRGFVLAALHANAVTHSRQIKPEIPLVGNDGIPIRDEIELEIWL